MEALMRQLNLPVIHLYFGKRRKVNQKVSRNEIQISSLSVKAMLSFMVMRLTALLTQVF